MPILSITGSRSVSSPAGSPDHVGDTPDTESETRGHQDESRDGLHGSNDQQDMSADEPSMSRVDPSVSDSSRDLAELERQASEGSADHQLTLGRRLLQTGLNDSGAVHWIINASRQGNDEATDLLKICLDNNQGSCLDIFYALRISYEV